MPDDNTFSGFGDDMFVPEPLHPELAQRLRTVPGIGRVLQHPYVYSVPYYEPENRRLNRMYALKLERLEQTRKERQWHTYVRLHERPYRINALLDLRDELTDSEYWALVSYVWMDAENISEVRHLWRQVWHTDRPGRADHVMEDDERVALEAMRNPLVLYRGVGERKGCRGLSWTLDLPTAIRLGSRYGNGSGPNIFIARGVADKRRVLAYFNSRDEEEIVIDPRHVHSITVDTRRRERHR